jgi:predicted negative regulator of RcsB-dependent stress response
VAKFTRKTLKQDRFAEEVTHGVEYVSEHRRKVITIIVAAVVAVVATTGWLSYSRNRAEKAQEALAEAINQFHGVVDTEERVGFVTFSTTIERFREVTTDLEGVITEYSGRPEADQAGYYLALLEIEQGKLTEARDRLAAVAGRGDEETAALARLVLGDLLAREGKLEEAKTELQRVVDKPTRAVPKERAQLALARAMAKAEPEKAKEILQELMANPGPVSVAAGVTMRQLEGT